MAASAGNVVSIVVKADNQTAAGFAEAKGGADEVAVAMDEYAAASDRATAAQTALADASTRLAEVQASDQATADELAAAQDAYAAALDRASAAALASVDAQTRLVAAEQAASVSSKESGAAAETTAAKTDAAGGLMAGAGAKMKMAALGVAVGMGVAVKAAANFQDSTTHLVTDAGESASALALVQRGILAVAAQTGNSAADITNAMYHVESAGYHGAQGLAVLKVAAEGAKVGGADLDTVGKSLTGTMNAYGMSSTNAATQTKLSVSMMNQLIAAVGAGDMRMQDLASSLGNVAPVAAAAKISFADVGGAIATMTAQNMSADQATQDLRHTILALQSPNAVAQKEMKALGLSASDLSQNLGKRGLAATMEMVTAAAHQHAAALGQTYTQAMYKAMGGTVGLTTALMLSGSRMDTFKGNVATVAAAAAKGGDSVDNWSTIQATFNFRESQAADSTKAAGIALGDVLLPAVSAVLGPIAHLLSLIASNHAASIALAVVIGGVLAGAIGSKLAGAFRSAETGIRGMASGVEWLIAKMTGLRAATEAQTVATEAEATATEEADVAMAANPIGLVIAAIVALIAVIYELVKHWKQVSDAAEVAWKAITLAVSDSFNWVKSHWPLLLEILTGPIGMAAAYIIQHWRQILTGAQDMIGSLVSWFHALPGRILSAVGDLGSLLFSAGQHVISGLIHGIESMAGSVGSAISNIAGEITSHLPFSPAKKGPLSGPGDPQRSGMRIAQMLGAGMLQGAPAVAGAASRLAAAAGIGPGGAGVTAAGAVGAGGPLRIQLEFTGGSDPMITALRNAIRVRGGNVQAVLGYSR